MNTENQKCGIFVIRFWKLDGSILHVQMQVFPNLLLTTFFKKLTETPIVLIMNASYKDRDVIVYNVTRLFSSEFAFDLKCYCT